jgi:SPOR domain
MSDGPFPRPPRAYPPRAPDDSDRNAPSSDPLLELARLIGQSDPFGLPPPRSGDTPRGNPDLPMRGPMARPPSREVSPGLDRYDPERERAEPPARAHPFPSLQAVPSRSFDDRGDDGYSEPAAAAPQPAAPDRFEFPAIGGADRAAHGHSAYADETYPTVPDQHYPAEPEPADAEDDRYPHLGSARPEAPHQDAAYAHEGEHEGEYGAQYADAEGDAEGERYDEYEYAEGDEGPYEDEESGGKRRNTIKIALAVLGVVVFGSAAAFGYRTVFRSGTDGPPPLIRADTSPTKVVPASASADGSSKPINDRLGGERMVSREEQPVDLRDAGRNANGGLVVPQAGGASTGVAAYPATPAAGAAAPASPTEPKRVRTVTIHADPTAPVSVDRVATPNAAAPAPAAPPRPAAVPRPAAPAPQAAAPSQPAAAPMTLTPQSQPSVAAVDTARPPAPARAAPRAVESGGGGWVVQLSAQKTEAEAQSAFRAAQSKYSVLSGYQPLIRKKDRGDRGVFYGAQVGPFPQGEANQLCESLKSAGSDCFVIKN